MVDRQQRQQEAIARAAAAERGESAPDAGASATPATVTVRVKPDLRKRNYEYSFGKAHGFSADYEFNAGNYFTQELAPADAEELRSRKDKRFTVASDAE
jgi:hypothetical protein